MVPCTRMGVTLCVLYASVLLVLSVYGIHRSYLCFVAVRLRERMKVLKAGVPALPANIDPESVPTVTIQLPIYNEATVVDRLLDAVAKIVYPASRLEIQVLDDSTDETTDLVRRRVDALREAGLDI